MENSRLESPTEQAGTSSTTDRTDTDNIEADAKKETVQDSVNDNSFNFETKTVTLNSGYEISIYGIGTYSLLDEECVSSVSSALKNGVRLIDTAYMYHNKECVGEAIRNSGIPREDIFVITKIYPNQFADAKASIEEALNKLDIQYIDLMLLHHPGEGDVEAYHAISFRGASSWRMPDSFAVAKPVCCTSLGEWITTHTCIITQF